MLDHGAAGLLNRGTGPAAVEDGEEPAGKGSRPALPTCLRRNYIHATPILRGLGCNCNVAKPLGCPLRESGRGPYGPELGPVRQAEVARWRGGRHSREFSPMPQGIG